MTQFIILGVVAGLFLFLAGVLNALEEDNRCHPGAAFVAAVRHFVFSENGRWLLLFVVACAATLAWTMSLGQSVVEWVHNYQFTIQSSESVQRYAFLTGAPSTDEVEAISLVAYDKLWAWTIVTGALWVFVIPYFFYAFGDEVRDWYEEYRASATATAREGELSERLAALATGVTSGGRETERHSELGLMFRILAVDAISELGQRIVRGALNGL